MIVFLVANVDTKDPVYIPADVNTEIIGATTPWREKKIVNTCSETKKMRSEGRKQVKKKQVKDIWTRVNLILSCKGDRYIQNFLSV